jgi:hypothetical protein
VIITSLSFLLLSGCGYKADPFYGKQQKVEKNEKI